MPSRWRSASWSVVGLLAVVNLLHYANRNVVVHARVFGDLRDAFAASQAEIGLLGTAFIVPHALVTLPLAWLGDRLDKRRVIAIGLFCWSAAGVLSALSWSMESLFLFRAAVGAGTAACVPMANALICDVVSAERRGRTIGIYNLGLFLGGVVGVGAGALFGFPIAFVAVAAPGFLFCILVWRLAVRPRASEELSEPTTAVVKGSLWAVFFRDVGAILSVGPLRAMMIGAVLMAFAAGGLVHWFIEFLITEVKLSEAVANSLFGVALVGGVLGVVAGGFVADALYLRHRGGRQITIAIAFALSGICSLILLNISGGVLFYLVAFLLMFFISWYHGPIVAAVDDHVPPSRASTAQGTYIALMHLCGTAPSSYVVGLVADETSLRTALYLPAAAMGLAAVSFAVAAAGSTSGRDEPLSELSSSG